MSFAMAPKETFVEIVKTLYTKHNVGCFEMRPVWGCECDKERYDKLPAINLSLVSENGKDTKQIQMPKESYMMFKQLNGDAACYLIISPWDQIGVGVKPNEEFWVLGAKFLQNYYSLYNFDKNIVGFVESVSSKLQ